jgi:hypothetical protein
MGEKEGEREMSQVVQERVRECLEHAREFLAEAAPMVLSVTEVADRVSGQIGLNMQSTRRYVRQSVDSGELIELRPDHGWNVTWPGAREAKLPCVRLVKEHARDNSGWHYTRHVLTADPEKRIGTSYGPGNTTYLITKEQADAFVKGTTETIAARKKAEKEAYDAAKKAEAEEIGRREPGFRRELQRLRLLLNPEWQSRDNMVSADVHLHEPYSRVLERGLKRGELPIGDHDLVLSLSAWGSGASLMRKILRKGLEWYLTELPQNFCQHCESRIFRTEDGEHSHWWHWKTGREACEDRDNKAKPTADS